MSARWLKAVADYSEAPKKAAVTIARQFARVPAADALDDPRVWRVAVVGMALLESGISVPNALNAARYLRAGSPLSDPRPGALAFLGTATPGTYDMMFVYAVTGGNVILIGGLDDCGIGTMLVQRSRITELRWPMSQRAGRMMTNTKPEPAEDEDDVSVVDLEIAIDREDQPLSPIDREDSPDGVIPDPALQVPEAMVRAENHRGGPPSRPPAPPPPALPTGSHSTSGLSFRDLLENIDLNNEEAIDVEVDQPGADDAIDRQIIYELALRVHNGDANASALLEPMAHAAGVELKALAKKIITDRQIQEQQVALRGKNNVEHWVRGNPAASASGAG